MAGHVSEVRLDTVTLGDFRPVMTTAGMCQAPPEAATFPMCYGPEFVSRALLKWIVDQGIETALIDPGKPWQNGTTESFNGKFRDERLSLEWFRSRPEAKVLIETWRRHFNEVRPHSSLGYMTPNEFVASITTNAAPVTATERTAAVCGASALRSVAQPLGHGQTQKAELAACSN